MVHSCQDGTLDSRYQLKDAGLVAATAVTTVGGSAASIDLGSAKYMEGRLIIDTTACEIATGDETYRLQLQGSTTSNFASVIELATKILGHTSATGNPISTAPAGRHVIHFDNCPQISATTGESAPLRYIRLNTIVGGNVATGINFTAWVVRD